jgi:hypothetical protein
MALLTHFYRTPYPVNKQVAGNNGINQHIADRTGNVLEYIE